MSAASVDVWQQELARLVGAVNVFESTSEIEGLKPAVTVAPGSAEETAAVLRLANEHGLNVVPAGGMTKQAMGHAVAQIDVLLSTWRLNQVLYYDPGDLTFGCGAGMTLGQAQKTLVPNRQFLPFDAMQIAKSTVGGLLATNAHGPLKHFYGGVRDFCIGIEFATADGKVVRGGGRVVKNVAGYDLMKLMIGSFGTLGVVTSANFKVFPLPQQTRTFVAKFSALQDAMGFRDEMRKSALTPLCVEIASAQAQEYFGEAAPARDPDLYAPKQHVEQSREWHLYVRAAGSDRVLERYRSELGASVAREVSGEEEAKLWQWIADFEPNVMARHHNAMIVYIDVPSAGVKSAIEAAEKAALDNSCMAALVGRAAAGALVVGIIPLAVGPPSAMHFANAASALRSALSKDASAVVARCPVEAKAHFEVWGTSPTDMAAMKAVRAAMDPKGMLNRGRFVV
ncbi:MAG TPA: FAD-binding oxidoreductase [Terriglobales bacterium]|nr:FAD-binding oxidoreductase [Terriglobales bacterium]